MKIRVLGLVLCFMMLAGAASAYVNVSVNKETGMMTIDGKLFYPKIIWNAYDTKDGENWHGPAEVAALGFNVAHRQFVLGTSASSGISKAKRFLDACEQAGIYGIVEISRSALLSSNVSELVTDFITAIEHHPSFLAVTLGDEALEVMGPGALLEAYKAVKAVNPNILVCYDDGYSSDVSWAEKAELCDIYALQKYPYRDESKYPGLTERNLIRFQSDYKKMERSMLGAEKNTKALWTMVGIFGSERSGYLWPTYEQLALSFWSGVPYRFKGGVFAYGWQELRQNAEYRRIAASFLKNEIDRNAEWLAGSVNVTERIEVAAENNRWLLSESYSYRDNGEVPYVDYAAFTYQDELYIVLFSVAGYGSSADTTLEGTRVSIRGVKDQRVEVLSANNGADTYWVRNEAITIGDLAPLDYRVLKVSLQDATSPSILATNDAHGNISPSGTVSVVNHGEMTFTMTPHQGYQIKEVFVDGVSHGAISSYTFRDVQSDHRIDATFEAVIPATYTLTSTAETGGSVVPQGTVTVEAGSDQTIRITPDSDYRIQDVVVDGRSQGPITSYTWNDIREDHTIIVSFTKLSRTSYFGYDDFGGTWHDARQTSSDSLAWAAAAANMLEWTGWDTTEYDTAQDIFSHFEAHWTDDVGTMEAGWNWWVDGTLPSSQDSRSQVDASETGRFWPQEDFASLFHESRADVVEGHVSEGAHLMESVDTYLHNGYGVTVDTFQDGERHALAVWGYEFDEESNYTGLWVTDSIDSSDDGLVFLAVDLVGGLWHLEPKNREGSRSWVLGGVQAIERYEPVPEPGTLALVGIGLIGGFVLRRKSRRSKRA